MSVLERHKALKVKDKLHYLRDTTFIRNYLQLLSTAQLEFSPKQQQLSWFLIVWIVHYER